MSPSLRSSLIAEMEVERRALSASLGVSAAKPEMNGVGGVDARPFTVLRLVLGTLVT